MVARALAVVIVALWAAGSLCACGRTPEPPAATESPAAVAITATGMRSVDAVSTDARWLVGTQPREEGSASPKPLVRMDRDTVEQAVLCDWADPQLGYCSLAEQGGMIEESPNLLLELVDDNAVRGWFPDGGVYLVDTGTGRRTRIDVDSSGAPLQPAWTAKSCGGQCDYHQAPRIEISTDAVSGDGRIAAFCANYEAPKAPMLYVKDLATGELTRTTVRCGVVRFGPEDDDDEFNDEGMSTPQVSADGAVVHVSGDESTGGEYGRVGWARDTVYFPATGEARTVPGSGSMTRDGRTMFLRSGAQPEAAESKVTVEYLGYDLASTVVTPLPWMGAFLATTTRAAPVLDGFAQASDDGRLVLNRTLVHDVTTGDESDIAALLRDKGYIPTDEWGPLRISGDGSTILADVVEDDPLAESNNAVLMVTGWTAWEPTSPSPSGTAGSAVPS